MDFSDGASLAFGTTTNLGSLEVERGTAEVENKSSISNFVPEKKFLLLSLSCKLSHFIYVPALSHSKVGGNISQRAFRTFDVSGAKSAPGSTSEEDPITR